MPTTVNTLQIVFQTNYGNERTFNLSWPNEDLTAAQVETGAKAMLAKGAVFADALSAIVSSRLVSRTVTDLYCPDEPYTGDE